MKMFIQCRRGSLTDHDHALAIEVSGDDPREAHRKLEGALQRLVDGSDVLGALADYQKSPIAGATTYAPGESEPDPPHEATVCAGCGRPGSSTSTIPRGGVALHWVVRRAWVCIECYQREKTAHLLVTEPTRDQLIRALSNVLDAYERQRTRPVDPGGALMAACATDEANVAAARQLLAKVKP